MTPFRTSLLLLSTAAGLLAAPGYLPLQAGNQWTYRDPSTAATFQIRVGIPIMHQGNAYYKVTGYASGPLLLRAADNGNIYYFDDENDREFLLADFAPVERSWYDTQLGGCLQGYQPQAKPVAYQAAHSFFPAAMEVQYRNYSCADNGIQNELYVDNVGLVRRTVGTIAGPRTFELLHARVGSLTFTGQPGAAFHVSLDRSLVETHRNEDPRLSVAMRLSVHHGPAHELQFPSQQRYDIQLRNASGEVVYRWSDDVAYAQVVEERVVATDLSFVQEIPLHLRGGAPLPAGIYRVEAWLNTPSREFAAAAMLEVRPSTITAAARRK